MLYHIMNKDTKLAEIAEKNESEFSMVNVVRQMPNWVDINNITAWIESRHAPFTRKHIQRVYKCAGVRSLADYVDKTKAISLNDTLWIKRASDSIKWANVNPYKNSFNSIIANMAFGGNYIGDVKHSISPELSTGGSFAKCWKRLDGEIFMIKMGRTDWNGESDNEPFSEYFTEQIARYMNINRHAEYKLGMHKGKVVTLNKLFTSEKVGLVTMAQLFGGYSVSYKDSLNTYRKLGRTEEELFRQMLILDCISLNYDRHGNNYGVFFDNDTFRVLGMADIYDNNLALAHNVTIDGRNENDIMYDISNIRPKYYDSFIDLAKEFITPDIARSISRLIDPKFSLKQDNKIKMDPVRLQFINRLIKHNTANILKAIQS